MKTLVEVRTYWAGAAHRWHNDSGNGSRTVEGSRPVAPLSDMRGVRNLAGRGTRSGRSQYSPESRVGAVKFTMGPSSRLEVLTTASAPFSVRRTTATNPMPTTVPLTPPT